MPVRFEHPMAHRKALPPIARVAQDPHIRVSFCELRRGIGSAIRGAVVHHQDFMEIPTAFLQISFDAAKRIRKPDLLVVSGDDDGD